ncbi:Flp family type IVb pilin [Bacillus litorisediminis]|uniref:Flp family type IVb pilin n=1 Tax=Bacillus litorisediminis TaxID=2922713 RepID=UPI001FB033D6|nr:Flp family type IVb pilin [Bacillus litorisediminis]
MVEKMKALFVEEEGQGMTEYGLVLGVIAVAVVGVLITLREEILNMFNEVLDTVQGRNDVPPAE